MIPISLTLEGLYSYKQSQTIDFTALTQAGLFGIFGETGSGKSSILEAISFALYGQIERLNARDNRAYNMLNLSSNRGHLEFEFLNFENKKYKVVRGFRRNSRHYEDVTNISPIFYEELDGEWIPVEKSVEEILNLSYNNFKRTIIIPQGQFKEFLELGPTDRTRMMEEVFDLSRFDMFDKVRRLSNETLTEKTLLEGKLGAFENIGKEEIKVLKIQVSETLKYRDSEQKNFDTQQKTFELLKKQKEDFDLLSTKEEEFKKLVAQNESFENLEKHIQNYERIQTEFGLLFQQILDATNEKEGLKAQYESLQKEHAEKAKDLEAYQKQLSEVADYYAVLFEKREEEADWKHLMEIHHTKVKLKSKKQEQNTFKERESCLKETFVNLEKSEKTNQYLIVACKTHIIDPAVALEAGTWFSKTEDLQKRLKTEQDKIKTLKDRIQKGKEYFETRSINIENYEQEFALRKQNLNNEIESLQKSLTDLEVQQQLAEYSEQLHQGKACPLCGSENHPNIAEVAQVSEDLKQVKEEIQVRNQTIKTLEENQKKLDSHIKAFKDLYVDLEKNKTELKTIEEEYTEHQTKLKTQFFVDYEDFKTKNKASEDHRKRLEQAEQQKETYQKQKEALQREQEALQKEESELRLLIVSYQTSIEQHESQIKHLKIEQYESLSLEQIQTNFKELSKENDRVQNQYQEFTKAISDLSPKVAELKANSEAAFKQKTQLSANLSTYNQEANKRLALLSLSKDEVDKFLREKLDVAAEREKLQAYKIALGTVEKQIQDLRARLGDTSFDVVAFEKSKAQLLELQQELELKKEAYTKLSAELERVEKAFEEKKELLVQFETHEKRLMNLRELTNLFKAKGFVQFISGVYLRQLCDIANLRFHRMTRNQLSLNLNEDLNFEVIDYLNQGRKRSVKTLSGGQSFQVSLSLALALAESVQAKSKTKNNFFFIDEGFGTQDDEAINLVFETLLSLTKENKIVGIISHVAELKERMPASITVVKDAELGSLIH